MRLKTNMCMALLAVFCCSCHSSRQQNGVLLAQHVREEADRLQIAVDCWAMENDKHSHIQPSVSNILAFIQFDENGPILPDIARILRRLLDNRTENVFRDSLGNPFRIQGCGDRAVTISKDTAAILCPYTNVAEAFGPFLPGDWNEGQSGNGKAQP
jgi:hypothetical protein